MKRFLIYFLLLYMISIIPQHVFSVEKTPLDYVDQYIGTGRTGHTIISPFRPFAMVKPGPDTEKRRDYLNAKYIKGFSQLKMCGTGGNAQSAVLGIMPTTGKLEIDQNKYRSTFDVNTGTAEPGYYSIILKDYQIRTELTSTERVALYRITFPKSAESHVLINVAHAFNPNRGGEIEIVNNTTIRGTGQYNGYHGSDFDVAFYIEFSKPFNASGVWKEDKILDNETSASIEGNRPLGAYVNYHTSPDETILIKVGMSYVDVEGAKKNIKKELPDWDFESVRRETQRQWNDLLGKVQVIGGTLDQKVAFYTALYHTLTSPSILNDVDDRYEGFDGKIHTVEGYTYYGEFSLWDTYRTPHPLFALLVPQRQRDMVQSLLTIAREGGWLPKWAWSEGYTGGMLGDHAVPVIVDSYVKGIRDFDIDTAWAAVYKNATEKPERVPWGRRGVIEYMKLGFAPEDAEIVHSKVADNLEYAPGPVPFSPYYHKISGSASATLEFAYNDWCIYEFAKALNKGEDVTYFNNRAYYYKNVFDPQVGFMRPRNSDGTWAMDPFIPTRYGRHSQFYCEGNAWTYSWLVPHDVQGLINLMGGHKSFITKLDSVFAGENFTEAHYRHGNEPDMHYPYLYNYAGVPWKTQYFVRRIMDELYGADPETGLPGDDDVGTMSGWYVFSALGFYPIAPGSPVYTIGSPIFDKVEITLDEKYYDSKKIIIETKNNIRRNIYIQDAMLNGAPLPKSWLTHQELTDNGHLIFNMGPKSNKTWGRKAKNLPPSMTKEKPNFVYSNLRAPNTAKPDEYINVEVTVTNTGGLGTADTKLILFNPHRLVTKGMLVGHKKTVLAKGESLTLKFSVPLYRYRTHTLQVENLTTEVTVPVPKSIREGM